MRLESLRISWREYPKPHYEGKIEFKDENKNEISLQINDNHAQQIFLLCVEAMVDVANETALVVKEAILGQKGGEDEPEGI